MDVFDFVNNAINHGVDNVKKGFGEALAETIEDSTARSAMGSREAYLATQEAS